MQETIKNVMDRFDIFRHGIPVILKDYNGNWSDITPALKQFITQEIEKVFEICEGKRRDLPKKEHLTSRFYKDCGYNQKRAEITKLKEEYLKNKI